MLDKVLRTEGERVVELLRDALKDNNVNASGNLSRSIRSEVHELGSEVQLLVSATNYVFTTEEGRKPTSNPGKGVLFPRIYQWTIDKKIPVPGGQTRAQVAWAMTKSIHEKGTRLFQKGGNSGVLSDVLNNKLIDGIGS